MCLLNRGSQVRVVPGAPRQVFVRLAFLGGHKWLSQAPFVEYAAPEVAWASWQTSACLTLIGERISSMGTGLSLIGPSLVGTGPRSSLSGAPFSLRPDSFSLIGVRISSMAARLPLRSVPVSRMGAALPLIGPSVSGIRLRLSLFRVAPIANAPPSPAHSPARRAKGRPSSAHWGTHHANGCPAPAHWGAHHANGCPAPAIGAPITPTAVRLPFIGMPITPTAVPLPFIGMPITPTAVPLPLLGVPVAPKAVRLPLIGVPARQGGPVIGSLADSLAGIPRRPSLAAARAAFVRGASLRADSVAERSCAPGVRVERHHCMMRAMYPAIPAAAVACCATLGSPWHPSPG